MAYSFVRIRLYPNQEEEPPKRDAPPSSLPTRRHLHKRNNVSVVELRLQSTSMIQQDAVDRD